MSALAGKLPRIIDFAKDELRFRKIHRKYRKFTTIPGSVYVGKLRLATRAAQNRGSIIECGTWRGGMIAGIADVLGTDRRYIHFNSFHGLLPAKEVDGPAALARQSNTTSPTYYQNCSAPDEEARSAMSSAKKYQIIDGWFHETLPKMNLQEPIALYRMNADLYDSTKGTLNNFGPCIPFGRVIIIGDQYSWEVCREAVDEYAASRKWKIRRSLHPKICHIDV